MTGERERIPRLLALVPYLQAHGDVSLAEMGEVFGVAPEQIEKDLHLLWMCGLPGYGPGDLIDLNFHGDRVSLIADAGIRRPLKLTGEEALALVVALRTLAETPGLTDRDAVERALAKIEAAAGGSVDDSTVAVSLDEAARTVPLLQRAVDDRRAVRLRYYTATRDETTDRTVDPMRVFELDGFAYLEAWCRRAEGMRVFRVDRIEHAEALDEPAQPPPEAQMRDLSGGVFTPAPEHLAAVLRLGPAYAWVADYYPTESETAEPDGRRLIALRVADPAWVRALVLGAGGQVEVISPQWLADQIRAEAAAALAHYG